MRLARLLMKLGLTLELSLIPFCATAATENRDQELVDWLTQALSNMSEATGLLDSEPRLLRGEAKSWRSIFDAKVWWQTRDIEFILSPDLAIGNFDSDPDSELYLEYTRLGQRRAMLLELDGSYQDVAVAPVPEVEAWTLDRGINWDCDGDGIDELVKHVWSEEPRYLRAESISLGLLADLPIYQNGAEFPIADFDGDGFFELLGPEQTTMEVGYDRGLALGRNGKVVWEVPSEWADDVLAGDIDGDGRAELIRWDVGLETLAYGSEKEASYLEEADQLSYAEFVTDLTGDSRVEIVGHFCFFDPASSRITQLERPPGGVVWVLLNANQSRITSIHQAGTVQLVAIPTDMGRLSQDAIMHPRILATWDPAGRLVYCERFAEPLLKVARAEWKGTERLILVTPTRILVWP